MHLYLSLVTHSDPCKYRCDQFICKISNTGGLPKIHQRKKHVPAEQSKVSLCELRRKPG